MTTTAPALTGHYRFADIVRMEWIKLRSLRSTWCTLAVTAAAALGIAAVVGLKTTHGGGDLTNNALGGTAVGLLLVGVLGVLTMTSEYTSGTVRSTLSAVPGRGRLLAAKATVFGGLALVLGELASFGAYAVGTLTLRHGVAGPGFGHADVWRAIVLNGTGYCLIGLLGLGLGAIIRHTPAAIAVLVGGVYVAATIVGGISHAAGGFVPVSIVANSLGTTIPLDGAPAPWVGFAVLIGYAAVALGIGSLVLSRRDA